MKAKNYCQLLEAAELQFKFAHKLHSCSVFQNESIFKDDVQISQVNHQLDRSELEFTVNEEKKAAAILSYSATFILVMQMDSFLEKIVGKVDRFNHQDAKINNTANIVRLIRNAFAHDPLNPIWLINKDVQNKTFEIEDIIKIDTSELNKKTLKSSDYGDSLSLLRLSEFMRSKFKDL